MHLRIYSGGRTCAPSCMRIRPRPPGLAWRAKRFVAPVLPEVILQMGAVPLVPYVTPGTRSIGR